ncbi:MAG: ABC transporter ATP-binding protein [Elusimicrobia bacterium]|nr:ABC transporter ATP-binding protein [Elusimicrobiota bacterium]
MPIVKENVAVFSGVTKIYRRRGLTSTLETTALDGLSFSLARGEITGLLGLNGAGKTTIMKLLTGLLFPTAGSISVFGLPPADIASKRRIGFLPELPYFYPYSTAASALLYYARLSGLERPVAEKRLEAVIGKVGLEKHAGKKVSEFSKGMMQRLGIAQAVIHDPDLLILDEPVSGLDPLAIHDIRTLISEFNAEGKTVFLSSHSISELEKITDRVLIMVQGRLEKTVSRQDWESARGGLEEIFVQAVKGSV